MLKRVKAKLGSLLEAAVRRGDGKNRAIGIGGGRENILKYFYWVCWIICTVLVGIRFV
jgi:hypothetical protein